MAIRKYSQQPNEVISYEINFDPWASDRNDTVVSQNTTADAGLTVSSSLDTNKVLVVASGGANGERYKVTTRATTAGGLVKEYEFWVRIKEL